MPPEHGASSADRARPLRPSDGIAPGPARRTLDIVGASLGLILLAVPMALLWLLVWSTSPGPGIFRQTRVGQGGRPFTMYKFRTMRTGASGLTVTATCDPRLTKAGNLLREWSLDELPQLWNVLRGDMTLVGPRPETYNLAEHYPARCRWVFEHRPGLTGVSGVRLRDVDVLPPGEEVDLDNYIARIVPARAALDAAYLRDPSMRATFGALIDTVRHILGLRVPPLKNMPDRAAQPDAAPADELREEGMRRREPGSAA